MYSLGAGLGIDYIVAAYKKIEVAFHTKFRGSLGESFTPDIAHESGGNASCPKGTEEIFYPRSKAPSRQGGRRGRSSPLSLEGIVDVVPFIPFIPFIPRGSSP